MLRVVRRLGPDGARIARSSDPSVAYGARRFDIKRLDPTLPVPPDLSAAIISAFRSMDKCLKPTREQACRAWCVARAAKHWSQTP